MTTIAEPKTVGPWYSRAAFDPASTPKIVAWATGQVKAFDIQALAASGLSGLVIAGAIGFAAGVPVFAVRKPNEPTHSATDTQGVLADGKPVTRWAFVDDFIDSGETFRRVRDAVVARGLVAVPAPSLILTYGTLPQSHVYAVDEIEVPRLKWPGA